MLLTASAMAYAGFLWIGRLTSQPHSSDRLTAGQQSDEHSEQDLWVATRFLLLAVDMSLLDSVHQAYLDIAADFCFSSLEQARDPLKICRKQ